MEINVYLHGFPLLYFIIQYLGLDINPSFIALLYIATLRELIFTGTKFRGHGLSKNFAEKKGIYFRGSLNKVHFAGIYFPD